MLIWICALHCEAKPVIDYYRLQKQHAAGPWDLYLSEDMACVISGCGKIASTAATAWAGARFASSAALAWINLGTAGAAQAAIGEAFQLEQIEDAETGQRYYPVLLDRSELPGASCLTLGQPSDDYDEHRLFDMEASGFVYAALRFSSAELIRSIKVVSDNREIKTGKQRAATSALIAARMPGIAHQATSLAGLAAELGGLAVESEYCRVLTSTHHFSQTEQAQLRRLLRYLLLRDHSTASIEREIAGLTSGGAVISRLEMISQSDGEML